MWQILGDVKSKNVVGRQYVSVQRRDVSLEKMIVDSKDGGEVNSKRWNEWSVQQMTAAVRRSSGGRKTRYELWEGKKKRGSVVVPSHGKDGRCGPRLVFMYGVVSSLGPWDNLLN